MAMVKSFLKQLAQPSCRWGHKWGCWSVQGQYDAKKGTKIDGPVELQDITVFKKALVQQRKCLICEYIQIDLKVFNLYKA